MAACPICRQLSDPLALSAPMASRHGFACARCGRYEATIPTVMALTRLDPADRRMAALAAYIRATNEMNVVPILKSDDWEALAAGHLHTSVATKLRKVLERAAKLSSRPGEGIEINGARDYPLFDAASSQEVGYLLQTLIERDDLKRNPGSQVIVTARGWERLGVRPSNRCDGHVPACCAATATAVALGDGGSVRSVRSRPSHQSSVPFSGTADTA